MLSAVPPNTEFMSLQLHAHTKSSHKSLTKHFKWISLAPRRYAELHCNLSLIYDVCRKALKHKDLTSNVLQLSFMGKKRFAKCVICLENSPDQRAWKSVLWYANFDINQCNLWVWARKEWKEKRNKESFCAGRKLNNFASSSFSRMGW